MNATIASAVGAARIAVLAASAAATASAMSVGTAGSAAGPDFTTAYDPIAVTTVGARAVAVG